MTTLAHIMQGLGQTSSLPLYQQLQRALREAIDKRILGPDEALPAERQLASDLAVSRITVRKAIDGLVNEGLLVRRPGSGLVVVGEAGLGTINAVRLSVTAFADFPVVVALNRFAAEPLPEVGDPTYFRYAATQSPASCRCADRSVSLPSHTRSCNRFSRTSFVRAPQRPA